MKYFNLRDLLWIAPLSLVLGAGMSALQPGDWVIGWLAFSFLFLLSFSLLLAAVRWGASTPLSANQALLWMVAIAFLLRLAISVGVYVVLPVGGYDEPDDNAGYIFTDAHRRDNQSWELASSESRIVNAFSQKYAYDQYGGLLAFGALVYRYLSPDVQRPLLLVLLSAFIAALGIPFLWKAASLQWGGKVALAAGWIFALYPESVLLGGAAMREPYLMTFSAFILWGFVSWHFRAERSDPNGERSRHLPDLLSKSRAVPGSAWVWLGLGLLGMLLVSPPTALVTLVILAGWMFFSSGKGQVPWWVIAAVLVIFAAGLFLLSSAINREGTLGGGTPVGILGSFMREVNKWGLHQFESGSGWVQKLFDAMPAWLRLPFMIAYGVFQPVLPAALVEPTTPIWRVIGILRAAGWYALLPALLFAALTGAGSGSARDRKVWLWLWAAAWGWVLFTALRGGGDQWDNPRYRAILFLWQALLAGQAWVWWRETRNAWVTRVLLGELVFLAVFSQWYASRYFHWGGQMDFGGMVGLILGLWAVIGVGGWWWDRRRRA
ncbi:MAG: hypothetical protein HY869_18020 [Chloroflexi bacterium]|nr:hypothetical protein [Chloroflexota bacterium]